MAVAWVATGRPGELLAGELLVAKHRMQQSDVFWLPERVCVCAAQELPQWITLRPGLWEFWIRHDGNGLVNEVQMRSLYCVDDHHSNEDEREIEADTWRIGAGVLPLAEQRAVIEPVGSVGLMINLLSQYTTFALVMNDQQQAEALIFKAVGTYSEPIQCTYAVSYTHLTLPTILRV